MPTSSREATDSTTLASYFLRKNPKGCEGGLSVRGDSQNYPQMSGFLAERGVHADTLVRPERVLVGGVAAGGGQAAAGRSGGVGQAVVGPGAAWGDRGAVPVGVSRDGPVCVDRGASDDRDGDVHPVDGAQGALPVGVSELGGGGVGLDSLAQVLSDLAVRARTG